MTIITVQRHKIGDTVIWRNGKSKSKTVLPLGVANCIIKDFGTGPSGELCVSIELPFSEERMRSMSMQNPVWVVEGDIE
jgi:hypothetical protein